MPSLKLSLALVGTLCSLASGFVARPGLPAHVRASAAPRTSARTGARQQLTMEGGNIFDTAGSLEYVFERNRQWAASQDPMMFERLKDSQSPRFLYIGCSDSRVPAQAMMGLNTGDVFVHRNVANMCMNTDYSFLSVLGYAVEVLQVTDIIVCGHYGCGGVKAAMANQDHGLLEHYLRNIRDVQRLHIDELRQIPDDVQRHKRLIELNVQESCMNLFANPIVQKKQTNDGQPRVHGWVYDISNGLLKDLKIDFQAETSKYEDIYRLYGTPGVVNSPNMTPRRAPVVTPPPPVIREPVYPREPVYVNGANAAPKQRRYGEELPYKLGL